ncbi:DUF4625 domain-containing protein [Limibacterium fermenti]|uniref:DUF4625 domain-containing protein n=1 Tax=Limibacterium fermenti TaxID=3229863 RepID=UPI000E9EB816|nr:hypothetical protein [Porphyromonadaceae bacterium]
MTKKGLFFTVLALTTGLLFSSCEKEDVLSKPVISGLEVGLNNSKIGYIGDDLHIEAEIVAEGLIDKIEVEIHPEGGDGKEITVIYTKHAGSRNATLHEHIDIPADAVPGEYHLHLTVTDKAGNSTTVEEHVELKVQVAEAL